MYYQMEYFHIDDLHMYCVAIVADKSHADA